MWENTLNNLVHPLVVHQYKSRIRHSFSDFVNSSEPSEEILVFAAHVDYAIPTVCHSLLDSRTDEFGENTDKNENDSDSSSSGSSSSDEDCENRSAHKKSSLSQFLYLISVDLGYAEVLRTCIEKKFYLWENILLQNYMDVDLFLKLIRFEKNTDVSFLAKFVTKKNPKINYAAKIVQVCGIDWKSAKKPQLDNLVENTIEFGNFEVFQAVATQFPDYRMRIFQFPEHTSDLS